MSNLYLLDLLDEVLETVLMTGFIKDEIPVSMMLVAPSGTAKSQMLMRYEASFIIRTDSISSQGLFDLLHKDTKNEYRFMIIPDFNPTLSRRPTTVDAAIANLLSMTTDGTVRVDDGRQEKEVKHNPVAMLTACTPQIYHKHAKKWFALGIRRRIIPIHFTYSASTESKLQKLVQEAQIHSIKVDAKKLSLLKSSQPTIPNELASDIAVLSQQFALNLGKGRVVVEKRYKYTNDKVVPISPHVTLRILARAHALMDKRPIVNAQDVDFLRLFLDFTDPEFPKAI